MQTFVAYALFSLATAGAIAPAFGVTVEEMRQRRQNQATPTPTIDEKVEAARIQRDFTGRRVRQLKAEYEDARLALENRYHILILNAQDAARDADKTYNAAVREQRGLNGKKPWSSLFGLD